MIDHPTTVSTTHFAARLARLGAPQRYVVAVSGGADSMALVLLAVRHAAETGAQILCVTVDHQLRDGSAAEACDVATWCAALGAPHVIKTWSDTKPRAGLQAAARDARYRLLCEAAQEWRAASILTGHSADDQAETVFMRLSKGSGPRGLAGMRERTMIASGAGAPIALLRPLLNASRQALRQFVQESGQAFIDDPSNDDHGFERVRVRGRLARLYDQGALTRAALLTSAGAAQEARAALDEAESAALTLANGVFLGWGGVRLDARILEEGAAALLMRQLFFAVGGQAAPPARAAVGRTLLALRHSGAATLGGAIARRDGAHLTITREAAALTGRADVSPLAPVHLSSGARVLWDRRFIVENKTTATIQIAPRTAIEPGSPAHLAATPGFLKTNAEPLSVRENQSVFYKPLIEERFFRHVIRFG